MRHTSGCTRPARKGRRGPGGWLLALLPLLALPWLAGCASDNPFGPSDEEKDNVAREEYFETAALTYYDGGRYDLAEVQFRRVLEVDKDNKKAKRGLAKSLYMQASDPHLSRDQAAQKLREAQVIFEQIIPLEWPNPDPQHPGSRRYEVQTDLANVYADLADLYDRDVRDLRRAMKTDPNANETELSRESARQVANRNELLGKAVPLYDEALRASPNNPYALAGLAKCHLQLGNDEVGIHYAKQYLELSRTSQVNWKRELDNYAQAVGGVNKVTTEQRKFFLDKIQGAREKEKRMHLLLASVHMRRMEFGDAVQQYTDVIKMDAAVPAAYLERAQGYAALQQYSQAITDIEEYLKITDPQIHRMERMSAVQLLDRYQTALARRGTEPAARPLPVQPRPAVPPPAELPTAAGSPDG